MRRSLNLKRETLAELSTAELDAVHGGGLPTGETRCPTIPVDYCLSPLVNDTVTCHTWLTCYYTCLCR